ncbi:hypothetical protein TNIN_189051 [Trichonephila inaurata madagascariensis]|uniref:Uncharacterized protein n=1 Tax=Trichonephila inaurata madagascariensis TaxID=2747483 RepID=A0A8X7CGM1_9ARAC|nr:hypothetical protein TNIN_189051 [Trichonephila inaurata madagascariensis]
MCPFLYLQVIIFPVYYVFVTVEKFINFNLTEFPARYVFALLGFLGFFNVYAMRVNLNVAIIAMVKESNHSSGTNSQEVMACEELLQETPYGNSSAKSHSLPVSITKSMRCVLTLSFLVVM